MSNKKKDKEMRSVAVVGAGNGGTAIAAHMASCGASVNLCDLFPEYLQGIQSKGHIELRRGKDIQHVTLNKVTNDIPDAIAGAGLIMVVTPAFTHRLVADACWDVLEDGQVVVLNPGRTFGALDFLNAVRSRGCSKDIVVAETQSLLYSCRKVSEWAVQIYAEKGTMDISSIPTKRLDEVVDLLSTYYPQFVPSPNSLYTGLSNIGCIFHPAPMLLNLGRVEDEKDSFLYYWEGITPSVADVLERIDEERITTAKALGMSILSAKEWLLRSYDTYGDTLYDAIRNNAAYGDIKAPRTVQTRYLLEDVPMGLVPLSELGVLAGVSTPHVDAIITLASSVCKIDFRGTGRSLKNLGLAMWKKEEICEYLETGKRI